MIRWSQSGQKWSKIDMLTISENYGPSSTHFGTFIWLLVRDLPFLGWPSHWKQNKGWSSGLLRVIMPIYKLSVKGVSILQSSPFWCVVCICATTFKHFGLWAPLVFISIYQKKILFQSIVYEQWQQLLFHHPLLSIIEEPISDSFPQTCQCCIYMGVSLFVLFALLQPRNI